MQASMQVHVPLRDPLNYTRRTEPRQIRKWLKTLALEDKETAADRFLERLKRINRESYPLKQRFEIMTMMQSAGCGILDDQQQRLHTQTLPLAPIHTQLMARVEATLSELAGGYKLIVLEVALNDSRLEFKRLVTSIYHAMRFASEHILTTGRLYTPPPAHSLQDLYQLYRFAEAHELLDVPIRRTNQARGVRFTIARVFKRTCLFLLAQPLSAREGEAEQLLRLFEQTIDRIEISEQPEGGRQESVHVINLATDEAPTLTPLSEVQSAPEHRYLRLDRLLDCLKSLIRADQADSGVDADAAPDRDLAQRLLHQLTVVTQRGFRRIDCHVTVQVALGLEQIQAAIRYPAGTGEDGRQVPKRPTWTLLDCSAGGYRLAWRHPEPPHAKVGELLAIRQEERRTPDWRIGVIRWIQRLEPTGLQIGVQVLAAAASAACIQSQARLRSADDSFALLLHEQAMDTTGRPATVLVPAGALAEQQEVIIHAADHEIVARVTHCVEATGSFGQFEYLETGHRERPGPHP